MKNRPMTMLLVGTILVALVFLVAADAGETGGRYAIAATSAQTPGGYILEVFVLDTRTGIVKQVVSDRKNQLGLPFQEMKAGS